MAKIYNLAAYLETWPQRAKAASVTAVQYGGYRQVRLPIVETKDRPEPDEKPEREALQSPRAGR